MRSKDRGPGIRTPQEQLLLSMLYFVGTDEYLDTGWDRDPVFFNIGGGHYRTHRQCPLGALPSTSSSTSVVDDAGPASSALQGARHRCHLQHRWWTLSDPLAVPPRGATIDVFFNLSGGCCQTH
jgi:hypothetical protein